MPTNTSVICDQWRMKESSFDKDGLRHEKSEPHVVVVQCLAGRYELTVDGRPYTVLPGEWYVASSYSRLVVVHRRAPDGPMRARWFKMRYHLNNGLNFGTLWRFPVLWRGNDAKRLVRLWKKASMAYGREDPAAWVALQQVFMELLDLLCSKGTLVQDWDRRVHFKDTFSILESYVAAHLDAPLTPAELAKALAVSESHLYTVFRHQIGLSPATFVKYQRMDAARTLLETTNHSVKEIARVTGFANPFHFSREFRTICGVSPKTYRQQNVPTRADPPHASTPTHMVTSAPPPRRATRSADR